MALPSRRTWSVHYRRRPTKGRGEEPGAVRALPGVAGCDFHRLPRLRLYLEGELQPEHAVGEARWRAHGPAGAALRGAAGAEAGLAMKADNRPRLLAAVMVARAAARRGGGAGRQRRMPSGGSATATRHYLRSVYSATRQELATTSLEERLLPTSTPKPSLTALRPRWPHDDTPNGSSRLEAAQHPPWPTPSCGAFQDTRPLTLTLHRVVVDDRGASSPWRDAAPRVAVYALSSAGRRPADALSRGLRAYDLAASPQGVVVTRLRPWCASSVGAGRRAAVTSFWAARTGLLDSSEVTVG